MNVSSTIKVSDLVTAIRGSKMNGEMKTTLIEFMSRVDLFTQDLVFQLKKEPTIFPVDPDEEPEVVEGYKPGDVAIYVDGAGDTQVEAYE